MKPCLEVHYGEIKKKKQSHRHSWGVLGLQQNPISTHGRRGTRCVFLKDSFVPENACGKNRIHKELLFKQSLGKTMSLQAFGWPAALQRFRKVLQDQPVRSGRTLHSSPSRHGCI
ncbi:hypothetical protein AOLI_G00251730 [Acnodon oligacanthus]